MNPDLTSVDWGSIPKCPMTGILALTKAFMKIKVPKLRRRIVDLVEEIAGEDDD